jgi:GNAT superfamily N-acetyltransferase
VETARSAAPGDIPVISELWVRALGELDGERGGALLAGSLARHDTAGWLEGALLDPQRLVVVGLIDEVAVGLASVVDDRQHQTLVGRIELIYVEPGARQVGVAEAMVDVVLEWCRARGCVGVDAPALPGNRRGKAFFEDNGFLARLLVMHRPIAADADGPGAEVETSEDGG